MARRNNGTRCFYCDGLVRAHLEGDHFPIPERNGGIATVACCESCHDMKDRFQLEDWPEAWVVVILDQWPILRRETRIFLAKAITLFSDAMATQQRERERLLAEDARERAEAVR